MKLSVSNLAWPIEESDWCLEQLVKHNIDGIELAPLKVFESWNSINQEQIQEVKNRYESVGLKISSLQAITYGAENIALYGEDRLQIDNFLRHIDNVAFLLNQLGGDSAVFGSPGLRDKLGYDVQELVDVFFEINGIFSKYGVNFALETVPAYYGCHLFNNLKDTSEFLNELKLSNVSFHFDSGCQYLSKDFENEQRCIDFISNSKHLHISEVDLKDFSCPSKFNLNVSEIVNKYYNGKWCVLEMSDKSFTHQGFLHSIANFSQHFSK